MDWYTRGTRYWVRFIFLELVADAGSSVAVAAASEAFNRNSVGSSSGKRELKVGDRVRVRRSVATPRYKWGCVDHSSIGVITRTLYFISLYISIIILL